MDIIKVLRRQRELRWLTQTDIAKSLGISLVSVQNYENGKRKVPLWVVEAYAKELGLEIRLVGVEDLPEGRDQK